MNKRFRHASVFFPPSQSQFSLIDNFHWLAWNGWARMGDFGICLCAHYRADQKAASHLSSIKVKSHFLLFAPLDGIKYANRPTTNPQMKPQSA